MTRSRLTPLALGLTLLAAACSKEKPAAAPPPPPSEGAAPAGGLRPLTSRDEAKPFVPPGPSTGALPPGHPPIDGGGPTSAAPAREGAAISGTVTLAPALAGRAGATDVLYLIARSRASKTVAAVRREQGVRFPFAFELSAADAMTKEQPFVGPFDVVARLSKSGDAIPAPGDLEGTSSNVAEGAKGVAVLIDKVRQ